MLIRSAGPDGFVRTNADFLSQVGYTNAQLISRPFIAWIAPEDHSQLMMALKEGGGLRVRHCRRAGGWLTIDVQVAHSGAEATVLAQVASRKDEPKKNASEDHNENIDKATVNGMLHMITRIISDQNPGYRCSIRLVADGRFVHGAGPSLAEGYNAAIEGCGVGPTVGSCGTAIYWNIPVIAQNLQSDPLWASLADVAKSAGVGACWSHPISGSSGTVLGALALHASEPRAPTEEQFGCLRAAARMTGLVVERWRTEAALREQRNRERELEEQLRQAAKMEAFSLFAGGITHDLNNIFATISANAELALMDFPSKAEAEALLNSIIVACARARGFCERMLASPGRVPQQTSCTEVAALLLEARDLVRAVVSKKVRLVFSLQDQPIYVDGDEIQLIQVAMNLLANAAEAIGDNEGQITVATQVIQCQVSDLQRIAPHAHLPTGEYLYLTVRDDGCGMDEFTAERVFDPFFSTKFTGRGLGLAAAKGILQKHGGTITMDSRVGEGTTFAVVLPTRPVQTNEQAFGSMAPAGASQQRILIVDDEAASRSVLGKLLKRAGFEITEAVDVQQAVKIFEAAPEALGCVLLGLSVPRQSREEVLKRVRDLPSKVPIVLLSELTEEEVLERFKGNVIASALQKPIHSTKLIDALERAMRHRGVPVGGEQESS